MPENLPSKNRIQKKILNKDTRPIPPPDEFKFSDIFKVREFDSIPSSGTPVKPQINATPPGQLAPQPRPKAFPNAASAQEFVKRYGSISDTVVQRLIFFERPEFGTLLRKLGLRQSDLGKIVTANRAKNLMAFDDFFTNEFAKSEEGKALLSELESAAASGFQTQDLVKGSRSDSPSFTDRTDRIPELVLKRILRTPTLRKRWLVEVDKKVREISDENLGKIDLAETQNKPRVKKNIVIIGGGPLTSLITSVLGPYFDVTVITDQQGIGEPWRSNPFFINSSVENDDPDAAPLPLLGGGTTPIVAQGQGNHIQLANVLDENALSVVCDEGQIKRYISGTQAVGPAIATNVITDVADFIVDHRVDPKETVVNSDGTKTLTLVASDGTRRKIDVNTAIFLTGPGNAATAIKDEATRTLAEQSPKDLAASIAATRKKLQDLTTDLALYEDIARMGRTTDVVQNKIKYLQDQIANLNLEIPRVLNLSDIQAIYQFWLNDLGADPKRFPLAPLFKNTNKIGIIGAGDSGNVVTELLKLMGPRDAYPADLTDENTPALTLFNQPAKSLDDFSNVLRARYKPVFWKYFGKSIFANGFKASSYREINSEGRDRVEVQVGVFPQPQVFDYVFDTTGYTKETIVKQFPFPLDKVKDTFGEPVALGANGVYVAGTATGFELADFPEALQNIIKGLKIRENTKALWVFGILTERLTWSIAEGQTLDADRIENLFKKPKQIDYLQSLRSLFE